MEARRRVRRAGGERGVEQRPQAVDVGERAGGAGLAPGGLGRPVARRAEERARDVATQDFEAALRLAPEGAAGDEVRAFIGGLRKGRP